MKKLFDKTLKDAATGYRLSPEPGGWQELSTRLDAYDAHRKDKGKWLRGFFILLLVTAAGWLSFTRLGEKTGRPVAENVILSTTESISPALKPEKDNTVISLISNNKPAVPVTGQEKTKTNRPGWDALTGHDFPSTGGNRRDGGGDGYLSVPDPVSLGLPRNYATMGLAPASSYSGTTVQDKDFQPALPKYFFSARFTPGLVLKQLNVKQAPNIHKNYASLREKQEKNRIGFSAGVNFSLPLSRKILVEVGIQQTIIGERVDYNFKYNEVPVYDASIDEIVGYLEVNDTVGLKLHRMNSYTYLNIPVSLLYNFQVTRKFSLVAGFQGVFMYLNGVDAERISFIDMIPEKVSIKDMKRFNSSAGIIFGARRDLGKYLQVQASAVYSKVAGNMYRSDRLSSRPGCIGLGLSLNYKLY